MGETTTTRRRKTRKKAPTRTRPEDNGRHRLTKGEILGADDLPTEDVFCPEWGGGYVTVKTMTGEERDAFEELMIARRKGGKLHTRGLKAKLVQLTAVDEDGNPMFTEAEIAALNKKSCKAVDRLFGIAQRMNGLRQEDVDELVGNSPDGPSDASGSA